MTTPVLLTLRTCAGASGYVLKRAVDTEFADRHTAVHRGGVFVTPSLAHVFVQDTLDKAGKKPLPPILKILSERERQVLGLVAQGYGSQEIAKQFW